MSTSSRSLPRAAIRALSLALRSRCGAVGCLSWFLFAATPARAIINLNFTPRDLVRSSERIYRVEASAPADGAMGVRVAETLRGPAPDAERMTLALGRGVEADEVAQAFGGRETALAVLFLSQDEGGADDDTLGLLQVGIAWFAVARGEDGLELREDENQMFSVWGGSASRLVEAVRYVESNPWAQFPVRAEMVWVDEEKLGELDGPAAGMIELDLGGEPGRGVLVLSPTGDRFIRGGEIPADATAALGIRTASRRATLADVNGDGRLDLISWTGTALRAALRQEDGTFAEPRDMVPLDVCLSLDPVALESGEVGFVVGSPTAPTLIVPDGEGGGKVHPVGPEEGDLGEGGFCVVADVTGNGHPDIVQLFSGGLRLYAGEGPGRFAAPQVVEIALPRNPSRAVVADFAQDGTLDLMVGGEDGMAYLSRHEDGSWRELREVTYELAYHGNQNAPSVIGLSLTDINADGLPGVGLFYADRKPMAFFNRGFACFGWARELDVDAETHVLGEMPDGAEDLEGLDLLQHGQSAGILADLRGAGIPDLLAVSARGHELWRIEGERTASGAVRQLQVTAPPAFVGPVTVTARAGERIVAMFVVRPGHPHILSRPQAGPVTFEWTAPDGQVHRQTQVVTGRRHSVELAP